MKMEHKSQRKSSQVSTSGDSHREEREKRKLISNLPYRDFLSSTDFFSNIFFHITNNTRTSSHYVHRGNRL